MKNAILILLAVLMTACAADVDNTREPSEPPALGTSSTELTAAPHQYTVFLASDEPRAVEAVAETMERLNGVIGYEAFVWGQGAGEGESSVWSVTIRLDHNLDEGPAVAVTGGAGSWCDMAISPVRGLNRFVTQHEFGHCFDLEHEPERHSWMYYAADYRTDTIPQADVDVMVARMKAGW